MEGASSHATGSPACNLVGTTEGGGKPRAPCGGPAGGVGVGGGGVGIVSGGDFDWGFPLTGIGSSLTGSFSSLSSSSSTSSLAEPPPTQLTALVEGVMGVMTSVKTLGRHPVLATVLWLLGGSGEDNDKENSSNNRSSATSSLSSGSSSNYHRQQQRQQAQYRKQQHHPQHHHHHHDNHSGGGSSGGGGSPDHVRRLRWNARRGPPGSSPPEANANDRIIYYVDRPTEGRRNQGSNESLGSSGQGWGHGLVHEDSQMIYPETIAVSEKITHMDRLEEDDLDPSPTSAGGSGSGSGSNNNSDSSSTRPYHHRHFDHHNNAGVGYLPHLQQHHDIGQSGGGGGGGGHDDVSPQWGWYVTLTPPKPAEFKKDGAGQGQATSAGGTSAAAPGAAASRSLRPGMTTASSSS